MSRRGASPPSAGFSLVEVVLALALLGSVLIAVSGLFVLASRQLDSGRGQTTALAVARDILEEMNGWSFTWLYEGHQIAGGQPAGSTSTLDPGYAARWQPRLDELGAAHAVIELESVAVGGGLPPDLDQASAIRVRVTVFWSEGERDRQVELATVRM